MNRGVFKVFMKQYIRFLPIFILPLGCIGISSGFQAGAILLWLISYYRLKDNYILKDFFSNISIKYSLFFMLLWVLGVTVSDVYYFNSISGAKEGWHYLQRMFPFFLVGLFALPDKKFFKYFWIGLSIAVLIVDVNVLYNFVIQNRWRPETMFGNPNKLAGFLILVLPFVVSGIFYFKQNQRLKLHGLFIALLTIIALLISGSRGAILGICGAYFIAMLLIQGQNYNFKRILISSFIFLSVFFVVCTIIYNSYEAAIVRGYDMERIYLWQGAVNMFKDYPIFGVGNDNFNKYYVSEYMNPLAKEINLTSPHNIFLLYLAERGLVAGLPFILMVLFQLYCTGKSLFKNNFKINFWVLAGFVSVAGMSIHGIFDTQLTMRTYSLMYWLLYGLSCYSIIYEEQNNE